jgi:cold shock CspA family protein
MAKQHGSGFIIHVSKYGYAFIKCDDGLRDIYVNQKLINDLKVGDAVDFDFIVDAGADGKRFATSLRKVA